MSSIKLKWRQVNAWRLSRQGLSGHLTRRQRLEGATRAMGLQAQVLSAAGLALAARVDGLKRQDVQSALWQERTLVKTWAMRGALHLIRASELPLFAAARSTDPVDWTNYFAWFGLDAGMMNRYLSIAPEVLGREPMTRQQFADAVREHTGSSEFYEMLSKANWGTPMKPLAWSGDLCFGPSQGQNITFVNAHKWLGGWEPVDPQEAWKEIGRRYLRTYGPANAPNFAHWWGGRLTACRKLFRSLEAELEEVEVEGWRALALRSTVTAMQAMEPAGTVNLLPLFDVYTLGLGRHEELEPHLPASLHKLVFRPQGWISAVVLVDGVIRGLWDHKTARDRTAVSVGMFSAPTPRLRKAIEEQAARLGEYLGTEAEVAFTEV